MSRGRKFNHEENKISDAVGMSEESFDRMKEITMECVLVCSSPSKIAEYLHENADYEQILLMATFFLTDKKQDFDKIFRQQIKSSKVWGVRSPFFLLIKNPLISEGVNGQNKCKKTIRYSFGVGNQPILSSGSSSSLM